VEIVALIKVYGKFDDKEKQKSEGFRTERDPDPDSLYIGRLKGGFWVR